MLILGRRPQQRLVLKMPDGTTVRIENVGTEKARLGIDAPQSVVVLREELVRTQAK